MSAFIAQKYDPRAIESSGRMHVEANGRGPLSSLEVYPLRRLSASDCPWF
jgi:hypothetical protein